MDAVIPPQKASSEKITLHAPSSLKPHAESLCSMEHQCLVNQKGSLPKQSKSSVDESEEYLDTEESESIYATKVGVDDAAIIFQQFYFPV